MLYYNNLILALAGALFFSAIVPSAMASDKQGGPSLLVFWRSDCVPCVREMEILPLIAKQHPVLRIDVLSLETHADKAPLALPDNVRWISAPQSSERTLENFGDTRHILPFSVFVAASHALCGKHYGILGTKTVDTWVAQC